MHSVDSVCRPAKLLSSNVDQRHDILEVIFELHGRELENFEYTAHSRCNLPNFRIPDCSACRPKMSFVPMRIIRIKILDGKGVAIGRVFIGLDEAWWQYRSAAAVEYGCFGTVSS